jgi:methyltransferase (TIGR00027 family)
LVDEARGASRTALVAAVARALHREEPPPWALDDHLAGQLADDEGNAIRERGVAAGSVNQYVILGAGLDTFAYRRSDLVATVKVFEVDHPATQAWKRSRLEAVGVVVPDSVAFVGVDFERQTLHEGLTRAGVEFDQPTIVSWLGVTMYLTAEAIDATLSTVGRFQRGSRLVLTYNLPPDALSGLGSSTDAPLARIAAYVGEPFVSLFRPDEIEDVLRHHGYTDIEHFGPDEAVAAYFAGRHDVRFGGAQRIVAASTRRQGSADGYRSFISGPVV